jgi:hypothetical protein
MLSQRQRALVWAMATLVGIWAVAWTGYRIAKNAKPTAEKVIAFTEAKDLSQLSGEARAKAIRELADKLNGLSLEERQKARLSRASENWFSEMTEEEKGEFIEATMPTGFKQMITAFEQMPEENRRRSINEALRRLRETNDRLQAGQIVLGGGTNRPPPVSEELQAKVRTIGLKAFYSESSAQTKAELAPVLEELQRVMEGGVRFRAR